MAKVLRCNDLMPGCAYEAKGATEDEVLAQAAEHARTAHGITEIPAGMVPQIKGAIRDEA
jgi:predicted small metal-binding protein